MNTILIPDNSIAISGLIISSMEEGFPSPAEDYMKGSLYVNRHHS
ncbi:hypothetical protein [Desulfobacter hydrogenophilus]|nr:hypothetical protein [Desulfobacter hydrogenophilus]